MVSKSELNYSLRFRIALKGHSDTVTFIAPEWFDDVTQTSDLLASGSEDSTIIIWNINPPDSDDKAKRKMESSSIPYGLIEKTLSGHTGAITEVIFLNHNETRYALSGSKDKTVRLWNVDSVETMAEFTGHEGEVLTVGISKERRIINSGGTDSFLKLWNINGECKWTFDHESSVTCIKYSISKETEHIVSADSEGILKVWSIAYQIQQTSKVLDGKIKCFTISCLGAHIATLGNFNSYGNNK